MWEEQRGQKLQQGNLQRSVQCGTIVLSVGTHHCTWLCEREVGWLSKTITLNRMKETRKMEITAVRVEGRGECRGEGRRRESFARCRQILRIHALRDICPTE